MLFIILGAAEKFVIFIKDMNKYLEHEQELKEEIIKQKEYINSKNLLIANLSHEIRTPINVIVGILYFLKSTSLDQNQMEYIKKLEDASNMLLEIVNEMFDVSKKDKNIISKYEKISFNLKEFFQNITDAFEEPIKEKNLKWYFNPNFDIDMPIYADKIRLSQIFINLINNAIKYTDKGYIELEANKIGETRNSYQLQFCLKDTGMGIKKEDSIKIFKEFEQIESVTTKVQKGSGMGLAIAKKIVENMQGKIWVESNFGLGSKFYFVITIEKAKEEIIKEEEINILEIKREKENGINTNGLKILLVEDDQVNTEITKKILEEMGIDCDNVENGIDAIKKVESLGANYYDLILMDIHMPRHDGYEISQILKKQLNLTTKIIAFTATNITNEIIEENKGYIYGYIQKPITPPMLKQKIKHYLKLTDEMSDIQNKVKKRLLLLGNNEKNINELKTGLSNEFEIICAKNLNEIKILLESLKIDLFLIDQLDAIKQYELAVEEIRKNCTHKVCPIIIINKEKDLELEEISQIININDFIQGEYDFNNLNWHIKNLINKNLEQSELKTNLNKSETEIENAYEFLYKSLLDLTSFKSKETGSHLIRTKLYMIEMLKKYEQLYKEELFKDEKIIEEISIAATLHDIGKVGIPDNVLNKPGKLTDEEYETIKQHAIIGEKTLNNEYADKLSNNVLEYAREIAKHHHEKYDGTGYPDKQKQDEIQTISKIMAVIDVYDALVNDRIYKKAMPYEEAEKYIISQNEIAFAPKIINIFILVKETLKEINEKYKDKIEEEK